jgi:integrase
MPRRSNQEGTIYEDANGVWWAQLPPDAQGKRPRRSAKTRKEAAEKYREMERQRAQQIDMTSNRQTLATFLHTWLDEVAAKKVKAKTIESYREVIRLYILPHLGTMRLDKLGAVHIQRWLNALCSQVSTTTARNAYTRLRTALETARRWRLVAENVAALVDPPIPNHRPAVTLTPEQGKAFLATVADHRLFALFLLALRTGMREGELLGLLWADCDLAAGEIRITGQMQKIGGKLVRTTTKTKKSKRTIYLDDDLIAALTAHQRNQLEEKRLRRRPGYEWHEHGLVFASEVGTPYFARNLLGKFKKQLQKAGLPDMRFHDLRHTAGSLMLAEGANIIEVSEVLGHSSPAITAAIYAHSFEDGKRRAVAGTARALGRA